MQGTIIKRGSVTYKVVTNFLFYASYLCISSLLYCSARDTVTVGNPISDHLDETLVSAGKRFELGFFTPESSEDNRRYIGIWYHGSEPKTIVWVANRDNPLPSRNGVLAIEDGNLNLRVRGATGNSSWSTSLNESDSTNKNMVKLMDSGNLVLSNSTTILWQSFGNPTDTFLPGMNMFEGRLTLTSWKDELDPGRGNFTFNFKKDQDNFVIRKNEIIQYWVGGVSGEFFTSDEMLLVIPYFLSNFTQMNSSSTPKLAKNIHFPPFYKFTNMTVVMSSTGKVQYWSWDGERGRKMVWEKPSDRCGIFNVCGDYGSCNLNRNPICKCLPGYKPTSNHNWDSGEFLEGCSAESTSCDQSYKFLGLKSMKVGKPDLSFNADNETECKQICNSNNICNYCKAYSYNAARDNNREGIENCRIWTAGLPNLQENYTTGGHNLSIRVATSAIESTTRDCDNCGTNLIPYPLSTGPTCGVPLYSSFHCDSSTDQLSFKVPGGVYRVSSINREAKTFVIAVNVRENMGDNCEARNSEGIIGELNQSLPFHVSNWCISISRNIRSIEIGWNPPPEPTCTSSKDCQDWPHSRCHATANGEGRCQCKRSFRWDPYALNCTKSTQVESSGRLEPKSDDSSSENILLHLIVGITVSSVSIFSCAIVYIYIWRRNVRRRENIAIRRNPVVHRFDSERHAKHLIDSGEFKEEDKKGIDVPFFEFESIVAATDNFSDGNKLGQGGYGPVYKGTLPGGKEIAVKRLSCFSGQGLQEFKNEIVLIAKLQHRNLVKLRGYCVKGEEKILLYEYMPNRSLDAFIFDSKLSGSLNWEMRLNIISGIARGLLYLHQDSRLRIIHRDMKTSNILLDEEMNPKISDFGLARIVGGKQNEANTNRVVGTYGYMSPEYALDGIFSVKSDVFSFGVVLLEIISGKRNTGFSNSEEALNLLGYAWRLWKEEHVLDLMDEALHETCNRSEFIKCVNVGLLCVQEDPNDRPTMSNVVFMLGSENASLPSPKPAAFVLRRGVFSMASSSSKTESNADNFMFSFEETR